MAHNTMYAIHEMGDVTILHAWPQVAPCRGPDAVPNGLIRIMLEADRSSLSGRNGFYQPWTYHWSKYGQICHSPR